MPPRRSLMSSVCHISPRVYLFRRAPRASAAYEPIAIPIAIHIGGVTPTSVQLYLLGQGVRTEPPPHRRRPCDEAVCSLAARQTCALWAEGLHVPRYPAALV